MKYNLKMFLKEYKHYYKVFIATFIILILGITYCVSNLFKNTYTKPNAEDVSFDDSFELTIKNEPETTKEQGIFVYVCGYVNNPGVYEVGKDTRIFEVIQLAGGYLEEANIESINLADKVADGMKIYVPSTNEASDFAVDDSKSKININTAKVNELTSLPGIGESRAKDIVNYRDKNGYFKKIEDIMNIPGIKEAAFEKIKDLIRVMIFLGGTKNG